MTQTKDKKTSKKSEPAPDLMAHVPIYGPMLAIDNWWPESAIARNIVVSKIMLVAFTVMSMAGMWFFWMFVVILCLHTLEYFSEEPPNQHKKKLAECKCHCE